MSLASLSVMCLSGLVLFTVFPPGVARRSVRIDRSQYAAQQQINTFSQAFEASADAQDAVRTDEPVDAAMLAEALDSMHWLLGELTESPTKLQRWVQNNGPVQDLAKEYEVLNQVKSLVAQARAPPRAEGATAAAAEMTDVLAKAEDLLRIVEQVMTEPDLKKALLQARSEALEGAKPMKPPARAAFGPKGKFFQLPTRAQASASRFARRVARNPVMQTQADLEAQAKQLNPTVGYWDPLNLAQADFWNQGDEATIGFLRHAEIKHGRVAMAAFVGFVLQSNGIHFPGNLANGVSYESIAAAGGPADQWDAVPLAGRAQIILFVGFLEFLSENNYILGTSGMTHYMRGGKPGAYPSIKKNAAPHPIPFDLYDPFGLAKRMSAEKKERRLIAEVNNGRLAMFGIMGFVAEAKIPGSVPALANLGIEPYYGEVMTPFTLEEGIFASGIPLV